MSAAKECRDLATRAESARSAAVAAHQNYRDMHEVDRLRDAADALDTAFAEAYRALAPTEEMRMAMVRAAEYE